MRKISCIILLTCIVHVVYAVVATPNPILRQLPNGTWDSVYIFGDEKVMNIYEKIGYKRMIDTKDINFV